MMKFKLLILTFLTCSTAILHAQKPPTKDITNGNIAIDSIQKLPQKLIGVARATGDSVILRWAPSTVGMWLALSSSGVVIERFEMDATTKQLSKSQRLTPEPIRAWDSLKWKPAVQKSDNPMFLLAAQCLLGEWSVPQTSSIESFRTAWEIRGTNSHSPCSLPTTIPLQPKDLDSDLWINQPNVARRIFTAFTRQIKRKSTVIPRLFSV